MVRLGALRGAKKNEKGLKKIGGFGGIVYICVLVSNWGKLSGCFRKAQFFNLKSIGK